MEVEDCSTGLCRSGVVRNLRRRDGRCGDIEGVWIEPVMAQLTMTLLLRRILSLRVFLCSDPAGDLVPRFREPHGDAGTRSR